MLPLLRFAKRVFENTGLGLFLHNSQFQKRYMASFSLSLFYICPSEICLILFSYTVQIGPTLIYLLKKVMSI